jgi:hypothetical protein
MGGVVTASRPQAAVMERTPGVLSRADLLALARSDRPWTFVLEAWRYLDASPQDDQVRLLYAANLVRLGLRTMAEEQVRRLEGAVVAAPGLNNVRQVLQGLEDDRAEAGAVRDGVRACLDAIRARAMTGAGWLEGTEVITEHIAAWAWYRGRDGGVAAWNPRSGGWEVLAGERVGRTDGVWPCPGVLPRIEPGTPSVYVEGDGALRVALQLRRVMTPDDQGRRTRLVVVSSDAEGFVIGLCAALAGDDRSAAEIRALCADPHVECFIGEGAGGALHAALERRAEQRLDGVTIVTPSKRPVEARARDGARLVGIDQLLARAQRHQEEVLERLCEQIERVYAGRDRAWWAQRYAEALRPGSAEPLRVLIPTCRFSTFIRHSSADIAEALSGAGCEARVLIEPDVATQNSSVACARVMAEWRPDLVVLINYPRGAMGGVVPAGVPFVCWVQDAMPHLFDAGVGAAQGEADFVVGHLHEALFSEFGWPRSRARGTPVLVRAGKFTGGGRTVRRRDLECEVCCVTNHAETPEAMAARLRSRADGLTASLIDACAPEAVRRGMLPNRDWSEAGLDLLVEDVLARRGMQGDARARSLLLNAVVRPLADRALRHQMLRWAAEICERRGWRLHLYGRGWETHPDLARFARGPVAHGEELAAAYAGARVNLHGSIGTVMHQRLLECAAAGGFSLVRTNFSVIETIGAHAVAGLVTAAEPVERGVRHYGLTCDRYAVADHPDAMAYTALRQRMGLPTEATVLASREQVRSPWSFWGGVEPAREAVWFLGDLWEIGFDRIERLEERLERAMTDEAWREHIREAVRSRVLRHLTYERFVPAMVAWVGESLASPSPASRA